MILQAINKPRILQVTSVLLARADPFVRIALAFRVAAALLKVVKSGTIYTMPV